MRQEEERRNGMKGAATKAIKLISSARFSRASGGKSKVSERAETSHALILTDATQIEQFEFGYGSASFARRKLIRVFEFAQKNQAFLFALFPSGSRFSPVLVANRKHFTEQVETFGADAKIE